MYEIDKSDGWVKNWRKIKNTSFYKNPLASHLAQHLIREVNYEDKKIFIRGNVIEIKKGQILTGRKTLAKDTGLSEQNIRTCLLLLEKCDFLTINSTKLFSIITILNYEDYQYEKSIINQVSNHELTKCQPCANHEQEYKNIKIKEKITLTSNRKERNFADDFTEVWNIYPKKKGRKEALRHYTASVKTEQDQKDILTAVKNYLKSDRVARGYVQDGGTWFNNWRDWLIVDDDISTQDKTGHFKPTQSFEGYTDDELKQFEELGIL